ncbi:hypothetical protein A9K65_032930 (plasmid) [Mesorhizobium sp. WSM1497]|nr:hypothetical protein A9K65_032930 [Mesorhizobium sp. WSM1497]
MLEAVLPPPASLFRQERNFTSQKNRPALDFATIVAGSRSCSLAGCSAMPGERAYVVCVVGRDLGALEFSV